MAGIRRVDSTTVAMTVLIQPVSFHWLAVSHVFQIVTARIVVGTDAVDSAASAPKARPVRTSVFAKTARLIAKARHVVTTDVAVPAVNARWASTAKKECVSTPMRPAETSRTKVAVPMASLSTVTTVPKK